MPNSRLITNSVGLAYSKVPLKRHLVWGLPFSDYFLKDPASAFFPDDRPRPTLEHVKRAAIPHLERLAGHGKPSSETIGMLRDVLSLIYTPKELRYLASNTLLDGCMAGLRTYSALDGDQDLLQWEFGFLCFRVALLVVQVSILTRANMLKAFTRSQTGVNGPDNILVALSEAASRRILDVAKEPNSREKLFGTFITKDGEEKTTGLWDEGSYGGVPVEFLCRMVWRGRREILQICTEVTTTGWSFVFLLLKEHLRWALESGECRWPFEWAGIQMLAYRQILVAPSMSEIAYLTDICVAGAANRSKQSEPLYEDAIQDKEDIEILMIAVTRRMKPSLITPRLPAESAEPLLGWFTHYQIMPGQTKLVPEFLQATYLWIWAELADGIPQHLSENRKLVRYASHTIYFTRLVFYLHQASLDRAVFTNTLLEVDFVNLTGRLLLAPLEIGSTLLNPSITHPPSTMELLQDWKRFREEASDFIKVYNLGVKKGPNRPLADCYPDWLKIWRCFETQFPHQRTRSKWGVWWIEECRKLWSDLGAAFGYMTRASLERFECAYTRCPGSTSRFGTEFSCECKEVAYCSIRCQYTHWLEPTFEAHRRNCSEIWEDNEYNIEKPMFSAILPQ